MPVSATLHNSSVVTQWTDELKPAARRMVAVDDREEVLNGLDELGDKRPVDPNKPDGDAFDPRPLFMHVIPENNQVIVTCRVKDYGEIGEKLALNGAVTLQALNIIA